MAMKLGGDGVAIWSKEYVSSSGDPLHFRSVITNPQGHVVLNSIATPWAAQPGMYNVAHCAADGEVLDSWRVAWTDLSPSHNAFISCNAGGFTAMLSIETGFGLPDWTNILWWRFTLDDPDMCFAFNTDITSIAAPDFIEWDHVSSTVSAIPVTPLQLNVETLQAFPIDLCTGVALGQPEETRAVLPAGLVLQAGDRLPAILNGLAVDLLDAAGRTLTRMNGTNDFAEQAWPRGTTP